MIWYILSYNGDIKKAIDLQLNTIDLTSALFSEVNPIPVKEALNMIGFNAGIPRLPLIELTVSGKEKLRTAMINYGINLG